MLSALAILNTISIDGKASMRSRSPSS